MLGRSHRTSAPAGADQAPPATSSAGAKMCCEQEAALVMRKQGRIGEERERGPVWLETPVSRFARVFAAVLLGATFVGCEAFEQPCPQQPTACRDDARVTVDLGPAGPLTDALVAYRLRIVTPAGKDAAGTEQPAQTQVCLFSTPQNTVRCDTGPFVATLNAPQKMQCGTSKPDVGVNGDGAIEVQPGESSCTTTTAPLSLELSSLTLPEGTLTLTLERGEEQFLPLTVESAVVETRPDGPKCGNTCRERVAPLTLADLTRVAGE